MFCTICACGDLGQSACSSWLMLELIGRPQQTGAGWPIRADCTFQKVSFKETKPKTFRQRQLSVCVNKASFWNMKSCKPLTTLWTCKWEQYGPFKCNPEDSKQCRFNQTTTAAKGKWFLTSIYPLDSPLDSNHSENKRTSWNFLLA